MEAAGHFTLLNAKSTYRKGTAQKADPNRGKAGVLSALMTELHKHSLISVWSIFQDLIEKCTYTVQLQLN